VPEINQFGGEFRPKRFFFWQAGRDTEAVWSQD
jgi:hypothetical protein